MAGQPRKRAVIAELEKRARANECSVIEYVVDWIEDGKFQTDLADDISRTLGLAIEPSHLNKIIRRIAEAAPETEALLARARTRGARVLIERTVGIADDAELTSEGIQHARLRIDARRGLAQMIDPSLQPNKGASVHIHVGALHLDALRTRDVTGVTVALPASEPAQIAARHDVEDAQVIEIAEDDTT